MTTNQTDTTKLTLAIRQALKDSGPVTAERQLMIIGRDSGDETLALIVQELRPVEVTALLCEGDFTKPSLAAPFVTTEQFLGAFDRIGAKWGKVTSRESFEVVSRLLGEVSDFMLSVILPADANRKSALLDALLEHELGEPVIVALSVGHLGFLNAGNFSLVEKGTSQELVVEIAEADSKAFERILAQVRSLHPEIDTTLEEEAKGLELRARFVRGVIGSMSRRALKFVETAGTEDKDEEVFVGLD